MSQISPPIRILLVAVIGLIAVYMLFLKPKAEEAAPVAAAPVTATPVPAKDPNGKTSSAPGSAVNQAVRGADNASARADAAAGGAVAESEGGTAPATAAAPATATTPATGVPVNGETAAPAPLTKEALARLPKDVRGAVAKHKVLVLLFYNDRSADDRAVRRALSKVNGYGGQVFVDAHWIKSVSRYQAITRGADVEQSPTIVVADRNLKAETLVGYVDDKTIDQAVVDAIRASGGSLIKDPYFRKLDRICASADQQARTLPQPAAVATIPAFLAGVHAISVKADAKAAAVKAPKKHARFDRRFNRLNAAGTVLVADAMNAAKAKPAASLDVLKVLARKSNRLEKKFVSANGAHGLSCF
jgi:hypothetical protein